MSNTTEFYSIAAFQNDRKCAFPYSITRPLHLNPAYNGKFKDVHRDHHLDSLEIARGNYTFEFHNTLLTLGEELQSKELRIQHFVRDSHGARFTGEPIKLADMRKDLIPRMEDIPTPRPSALERFYSSKFGLPAAATALSTAAALVFLPIFDKDKPIKQSEPPVPAAVTPDIEAPQITQR